MDLKATIAKGYRTRLIIISVGALMYAAWAAHDGSIDYPNDKAKYEKYTGLVEQYDTTEANKRWEEVAKQKGWETDIPDIVTDNDIRTQWIQFAITFTIGGYCLISFIIWSRRFVGADDKALYSHGNVEVPFDKITSIDANRWNSKGIARVSYDLGQGEEKVLVLDDWKYERAETDAVFERMREHDDAQKFEGLTERADEASADGLDRGAEEGSVAPADDSEASSTHTDEAVDGEETTKTQSV